MKAMLSLLLTATISLPLVSCASSPDPAPKAVAAAPVTSTPAPVEPKLIIAISVDQFSAELFGRYRPGYTGGLARLAKGVTFTGYQSHAATETCPGHSTILTGKHPSGTGIVANNWFDVKTGSSIYCVSVDGVADPEARGPQRMFVDTFGDWLKAQRPGARTVAISGKDRAAIMMGGKNADAVYWWVDGKGFRTSSYAGPDTPAVTEPAQAFDDALFAQWQGQPPALWPASLPANCAPLQKSHQFGKVTISGKVPPEQSEGVETGDFLHSSGFEDQLRVSPIFDPMTLDFATKMLDHDDLGRGPATDLLAVSLSATDLIGHRYGNGGAEMCVQMAMLDAALGRFLDHVDALHIPYVVMLTADHGAVDAAERAAEIGVPAVRIDNRQLVTELNKALEKQLDLPYEPIVGDDPQQLVINVPSQDPAFRVRIRDAAVAWLRTRSEVAQVFTAEEIAAATPAPGKSPADLTMAERFNESYYPGRSGDIIVALSQYASIGVPVARGDVVAGHGSPWDYDRRVPILFWWPDVTADARPVAIETVDIAPTLAGIARLSVTDKKLDGRCVNLNAGSAPNCP